MNLFKSRRAPLSIDENTVIYGFTINGNESDPYKAVTYIGNAVGMTPAHMDFENDEFDYGSWENAFFMPRPCMLKYDGTVDYYLDPDDYSKKADGVTDSDVNDDTYPGNAMMEWGQNNCKIWIKITPTDNNGSAKVEISNAKVDNFYNDYPFHNSIGSSVDHFYTPIYDGAIIDGQMRSISGIKEPYPHTGYKTMNALINAAKQNNKGLNDIWDIQCFCDVLYINLLLILMGKSLDIQSVFGYGYTANGYICYRYSSGQQDKKGLFYGTSLKTKIKNTVEDAVKIFGMENYYGYTYRYLRGIGTYGAELRYKLTQNTEDGSTIIGYDESNMRNYIPTGIGFRGNCKGFISKMGFNNDSMLPLAIEGTEDTYYGDYFEYNSDSSFSTSTVGLYGFNTTYFSFYPKAGGPFSLDLNHYAGTAYNVDFYSAALSCKPIS